MSDYRVPVPGRDEMYWELRTQATQLERQLDDWLAIEREEAEGRHAPELIDSIAVADERYGQCLDLLERIRGDLKTVRRMAQPPELRARDSE